MSSAKPPAGRDSARSVRSHMSHLRGSKWLWAAFAGLVVGFTVFRGGMVALMGLAKVLLPLAIPLLFFYLVFQGLKKLFIVTARDFVFQNTKYSHSRSSAHPGKKTKSDEDIIDLCPSCGNPLGEVPRLHRCQS